MGKITQDDAPAALELLEQSPAIVEALMKRGEQLVLQVIAAVAVLGYSFVVALLLGYGIEKTIGFRIKNEDEIAGVDTVVHGEEGYVLADRIA